jgi:hypothetical protein
MIAVGICYIILGILTPAQADEYPPPEAAPAPESVPVAPGITCTATKGHPYQSVYGVYLWLTSNFSVNCQESGNYRIDRVDVDLQHGAYINGNWSQYSNDVAHLSRTSPGNVSFLPMRDRCNTGGTLRLYRQKATVEVTSRYAIGGTARHDTVFFILANNGTLACGNHEPG